MTRLVVDLKTNKQKAYTSWSWSAIVKFAQELFVRPDDFASDIDPAGKTKPWQESSTSTLNRGKTFFVK